MSSCATGCSRPPSLMCVSGWERLAWKRWQALALAVAGGVPPRCARLPPSPWSPGLLSSTCINVNVVSEPAACATTNMRLRSPPVQRMTKGGASAVRCAPPPRAVLPGIDACGYLRRSVMLQRSSGVSSSSPFSSVLENESECGELAALHAMGHTPARTANCPACSACAFAAETAAREGGKRPNMTMCCRRRVRTAVVSPRARGT